MTPRSGQVVIMVVVGLMFMCLVLGLAVDLGYSYFVKLQAQTAADAAAGAAAVYAANNGSTCGSGGVVCGTAYNCANPPTSPPTTAMQAGCLYAQTNGFLNGGNQSVSLIANNTTPPNESGNSPAYWVQATVSQTVPHLFLYWPGFKSGSVAAEAIGGITTVPATSCVYILSSSASNALYLSGAASLTASGCGIYDNSSNSTTAISASGSATITATQIKVKGGYTVSGGASITPTPTTGVGAIADPFASVTQPTVPGTCYQTNYNLSGGTATISPSGAYCGGITVSGVGQLTMNPGTYVVVGGGFNIGNSGTVTGSGVTIFLTGNNTYTAAGINLSGASTTTLSAPSSGTYRGILFFQDRTKTYTTGNQQGGSAIMNCTGSFYLSTTSMTFSGAVAASKIAIIASTLTISGSATFNQDLTGAYTGLASSNNGLIQ